MNKYIFTSLITTFTIASIILFYVSLRNINEMMHITNQQNTTHTIHVFKKSDILLVSSFKFHNTDFEDGELTVVMQNDSSYIFDAPYHVYKDFITTDSPDRFFEFALLGTYGIIDPFVNERYSDD